MPTAVRLPAPVRRSVQALLFAAGYLGLQQVGMAFTDTPSGIAAIWPAAGFAVGVLAARPRRQWPELLAALALVNLLGNLDAGRHPVVSVLFPLANVLETALGAWLLARPVPRRGLDAVAGWLYRNYLPALAVAPALGAAVAAGAVALTGAPASDLPHAWWSWFAADGIGIAALAPVVTVLLGPRDRYRRTPAVRGETVGLVAAQVALVVGLVHLPESAGARSLTVLLLLPLAIWGGLRTGVRAAALSGAVVTTVVAWSTAHAQGPFSAESDLSGVWHMQLFCVAITGTALVAARAVHEVRVAQREARSQHVAMAHAMEGVAYCDPQARYLRVNQAYCDTLDTVADDLLGRPWTDTVHPEDVALAEHGRATMVETGLARLELRGVRRDGTLFHRESVLVADRDPDGTLLGHHCFMRDVTSSRRAVRQAVRFFDLSSQLMTVTGADGVVRRVNGACRTVLGWTAEEFVGRRVSDLIHPEDLHLVRLDERRDPSTEGVPVTYSVRVRTRAGGYRNLVMDSVFDAEDGLFYAVASDVTDLQERADSLARARDEAVAASGLKSGFLATMSHEIRTPMNGVLGLGELLAHTPLDDGQRRHLDGIQAAARGLLSVINDVLDFSKIEAGHLSLDTHDFAVAPLVDTVLQIVRPAADGKGLTLTLDVDERLRPCVHGDSARLQQVLVNLVGNAVKFTGSGGVHVSVRDGAPDGAAGRTDRHAVTVTVSDTGVGMGPAELTHVFEPFVQVGAVHGASAGTGLGLAISRQIVTAMDGTLTAGSEVGGGSTFTMTVPLGTGSCADLARLAGVTADPRLSLPEDDRLRTRMTGTRVLLVEDIELNRTVATGMLARLGWEVDVAEDGLEAVERATTGRYAAVLMDCQMPRMDGYAATHALREHPATRQVPIVAMTANAYPEDRDRCLAAGMDAFLAKPITQDALLAVLGRGPGDVAVPVAERAGSTSRTSRTVGAPDAAGTRAVLDDGPVPPASAVRRRIEDLLEGSDAEERDLLRRVLGSYLASLPGRLDDVGAAFDQGDPPAVTFAAHALKSASLNVGAARIGAICARIEDLSRMGELDGCLELGVRLAAASLHDAEEIRDVATWLGTPDTLGVVRPRPHA